MNNALKAIIVQKSIELAALRTMARLLDLDLADVPSPHPQEPKPTTIGAPPPLPQTAPTRHRTTYPGNAPQVVLEFMYNTYKTEPVHTTILYANATKSLKMPKGTISGALRYLVQHGFVHKDPELRTYEVLL